MSTAMECWFERHYDQLQLENAKLREELEQWHRLTAGIELPEYPITEFKPKDLERENAKLRELVDGWDFCSKTKISTFDNCVGCPLFIQTPHSYRCARDERMRELGMEVDA